MPNTKCNGGKMAETITLFTSNRRAKERERKRAWMWHGDVVLSWLTIEGDAMDFYWSTLSKMRRWIAQFVWFSLEIFGQSLNKHPLVRWFKPTVRWIKCSYEIHGDRQNHSDVTTNKNKRNIPRDSLEVSEKSKHTENVGDKASNENNSSKSLPMILAYRPKICIHLWLPFSTNSEHIYTCTQMVGADHTNRSNESKWNNSSKRNKNKEWEAELYPSLMLLAEEDLPAVHMLCFVL